MNPPASQSQAPHSGPLLPPRSSHEAVVAGMRAMGMAGALLIIPLAIAPLAQQDLASLGHVHLATWAVVVSELAILVGLWLRPRSTVALFVTGAMLLGATLWWMPMRLPPEALNWWAPGFWVVPWICWAVTLLSRRTFAIVNGLALLLLTVLDPLTLWLDGVQITALRLAPVPWFTMPVALMALFGYGLNLLAAQADHQIERRLQAERGQEVERSEGDASREAARLLHDHVLHALHALSRGPGQASPHMILEECRTAVESIDSTRTQQAALHVEDLIAQDPALTHSGARLAGSSSPVPRHVALAMADAAHEALTNAVTHAQASHVEVEVEERGSQWHVVVSDDGRGFDLSRELARGRLGLRHSVQERLEDAGGTSTVTSTPGHGTTVHLLWPALDNPDTGSVWPQMSDRYLGRILARTSWPALAITPFMAVLAGSLLEPAWPMRLVAGALVLWGLWWLRRVQDRTMSWLGQAAIFVVTTLAWWLNLWLAPEQMETVYPLWIGWTAAGLVHLAVLQVPLWRGVLMLVLWGICQYTALVVAVGWRATAHLHISLSTGIAEGLVALIALWVARGVMDEITSQARVAEALRREASRLQARTHVERYWSKRVTDVALPLLRSVADGEEELACHLLQAKARHLEATLRDELVLGPENEAILDALGSLRSQGWTVRSTLDDEQDTADLAAFARILTQVGPPAAPGQVITLSGTPHQLVALVITPSPVQLERWRELAAGCNIRFDTDPDFARVSIPTGSRAAQPG